MAGGGWPDGLAVKLAGLTVFAPMGCFGCWPTQTASDRLFSYPGERQYTADQIRELCRHHDWRWREDFVPVYVGRQDLDT